MATFAPSTPRAPNASLVSPSPVATPRYAAAGIVVTETATPTPELALVSSASIPATPAASATTIVSLFTLARLPSTVESMLKLDWDAVERVLRQRRHRRGSGCERHADHQRPEGAAGKAEAPVNQPDADRRDRQEIGADRHRADDQDHVVLDHAVAGDHTCDNMNAR